MTQDSAKAWLNDADAISDGGERVSHLHQDAIYWAHLSIYDFAKQYCQDAIVLDAGSGAGYGAMFLAENGARQVYGIDVNARAIEFSRHHFQNPKLVFKEMSLGDIEGFFPHSFDFIFSSNTLEHVPHVDKFFRAAWNLLKPTGTIFIAVPPITDDRLEYLNIINPYHVNIWTPRQWACVLSLFFKEITPFMHGVEKIGLDFKPEHLVPTATLNKKNFVFKRCTVGEMYKRFTLTAIFVARKPRSRIPIDPLAHLQFKEFSFTRPQGYIDPQIRQKLAKYFAMPTPPYVLPISESDKRLNVESIKKRVLVMFKGR